MAGSEIDLLRELLAAGFKPWLAIRDPDEAEVRERLPIQYWGKPVRALPLARADDQKRMFYFLMPDTTQLAEELVAEQRRATGISVCVYCAALGLDAVDGRSVALDTIVDTLRTMKGWDVRESKVSNVFEVHFDVTGDDQSAVAECIREVDEVAIALSLENRVGFDVQEHSSHPVFVGQPLRLVIGLPVRLATPVTLQDVERIARLKTDGLQGRAARALRDLYSQPSYRLRLIVGWAALEDMFGSHPQHLLTRSERKDLFHAIRSTSTLPSEVLKRLVDRMRDANVFSKRNRNERLADGIARHTGQPYEDVYEKLRDASKRRGAAAHSVDGGDDAQKHADVIESILMGILG